MPVFVNYTKRCTRLAVASDKVYQLLAHGWWFSPVFGKSIRKKTHKMRENWDHINWLNTPPPLTVSACPRPGHSLSSVHIVVSVVVNDVVISWFRDHHFLNFLYIMHYWICMADIVTYFYIDIDSCGFFLNINKLDFQDLRPIKLLLLFSRFCSNYIAEYCIR